MAADKKQQLIYRVTQKVLRTASLLDLIPPNFTDVEALTDTLELDVKIETLQNQVIEYDFADVFNIVQYNSMSQSIVQQSNLFEDYAKVTLPEVATSNEWY